MMLVLAILALGLLIIGHEGGHYLVARMFGMRVDRFSVGFGPAILKWKKKETQFQVAAIPLGGFVQIAGMNPHEDFDEKDPRVYPNKPAWQRFLTIFAGPAANYVFAIVLIACVYLIAGIMKPSNIVAQVQEGPASGLLLPDDRIVAVDGVAVADIDGFREQVQNAKGAAVTITVERAGQRKDVKVQPAKDSKSNDWRVGIAIGGERKAVGAGSAVGAALVYPYDKSKEILVGLYKAVKREESVSVTGPVGITRAIRNHFREGWIQAFELLALLNVYLGLFNLLPLPALDGGRLVFLGYELAFRRRPNPKVEASIHMVGFVMLFVLMILVLFKDIKEAI
jgi:regulator of sigma E protease